MTQSHITTEQAKNQLIPGCDVYRWSSAIYSSDISRKNGAAKLYREAFDILRDSFIFKYFKEINISHASMSDAIKNGSQASLLIFRKIRFYVNICTIFT